jgi:hypothetical protein
MSAAEGRAELRGSVGALPLLTQAVWKRFSYPNNSKQPGVMDLDATV